MKVLRKDAQLTVRMSKVFRAKLKRGAKLVTRRGPDEVSMGDLLLSLAEPGLDELLRSEQQPEPAEPAQV